MRENSNPSYNYYNQRLPEQKIQVIPTNQVNQLMEKYELKSIKIHLLDKFL